MLDLALADYFAWLRSFFEYVSERETSIMLRESQYVMPWVFVLHVISMCMFAGTILMMDLRLLGVGNMATPFSQVQRRLFPWQMAAMFFSAATGLALVWGNPMNYVTNIIFWVKMLAMGIAGLNALAFHRGPFAARRRGVLASSALGRLRPQRRFDCAHRRSQPHSSPCIR